MYIFLKDGVYNLKGEVKINYSMMIIGAGRNKTFIRDGGFLIKGIKEEGKRVELKGMTINGSKKYVHGVVGSAGLSFLCVNITITQCGATGLCANNTRGRLINCVVTDCGMSGIRSSSNGLIELEGCQTKVERNGTNGFGGCYGLSTSSTASIHLLSPLTKESVSVNNGGKGDCGGDGVIFEVVAFGER